MNWKRSLLVAGLASGAVAARRALVVFFAAVQKADDALYVFDDED